MRVIWVAPTKWAALDLATQLGLAEKGQRPFSWLANRDQSEFVIVLGEEMDGLAADRIYVTEATQRLCHEENHVWERTCLAKLKTHLSPGGLLVRL